MINITNSKLLKQLDNAVSKLQKTLNASKNSYSVTRTVLSFDSVNKLDKIKNSKSSSKKSKSSKSSKKSKAASKSRSNSLPKLKTSLSILDGFKNKIKKIFEVLQNILGIKKIKTIPQLKTLYTTFKKLSDLLNSAFKWAFNNVLKPLQNWTLNKLAPVALETLNTAFNAIYDVLKFIQPVAQAIWDNLLQPLAKWSGDVVINALSAISDKLQNAQSQLSNFLQSLNIQNVLTVSVQLVKSGWSSVKSFLGNIPVVSQAISLVKSGWSSIKNFVGNIPTLSQAISLIKSGWTSVKNFIGNIPTLSQAISLIKSGWTSVKNFVGNVPTISAVVKLVKNWTSPIKALGLDNLSAKFNIKLPTVNVTWSGSPIKIPHFNVKWNSKGALLNGSTIFGAYGNTLLGGGESGRELLLPLDNNTQWLDTLASKLADAINNNHSTLDKSQNINLNVTLDGKTLYSSIVNYAKNETISMGYSRLALAL